MKFESAVDRWFYLVIIACVLDTVLVLLPRLLSGQAPVLTTSVVIIILIGLPLWLLLSTYYLVSDDLLLIRTGPFTWKIKLSDIHTVKPSRSWLSSPALSLKRLELRYGKGKRVLVSPKNQSGFLKAIGHENTENTFMHTSP